jgi:NAD-dependent dihydropyrimidine dehydrogenase PreA subunit
MAARKIVRIDEDKCNGCGLCIPNCAEGALRIVDGKARLITEKFCDGLGACLGHCPQDAITIIEREADAFDEKAVEAHLHPKAPASPTASLALEPIHSGGCPSARAMQLRKPGENPNPAVHPAEQPSTLSNWPVQLKLVPVNAPCFENADLLVTADCVPFAYAGFHQTFLKDRVVLVGCPKLDDVHYYREKLATIFAGNAVRSITVLHMEVPCCTGLVKTVEAALDASGKKIPLKKVKIGIHGDILSQD